MIRYVGLDLTIANSDKLNHNLLILIYFTKGKDEKPKEATEFIKEHLNCPDVTTVKREYSTSMSPVSVTKSSTIVIDRPSTPIPRRKLGKLPISNFSMFVGDENKPLFNPVNMTGCNISKGESSSIF